MSAPDEPTEAEKCGARTGCQNQRTEPHSCPYSEEINDNYEDLCTCCDDCRQECVWDI